MLSPDQIDQAGDSVAVIYSQIEAEMLDHLVGQLVHGESLDRQSVTTMALLTAEQTQALEEIVERHKPAIADAVNSSAAVALAASDRDDIRRAGGEPVFESAIESTVRGIAEILERDNLQMIEGAKRAFLTESTKAITKVNAGMETTETALHKAVRELERGGISVITYQNSRTGTITVQNKIDVAVRRHIRTQIAQDSARMTLDRIDKMGIELVEVSAHIDARPEHAEWQGQVYSLTGGSKMEDGTTYPDFYSATGYGSVDGLCGANCRHSFGPYRHGAPRAYDPDPQHESGLPAEEIYEMTQQQRYLERQIRADKRELRGAQQVHDEQGTIASRVGVAKAQERLRRSQAEMRDHISTSNAKSGTGAPVLHRNKSREWAGDMPKSPSVKGSGRSLDEFLHAESVQASFKTKGITMGAAEKVIRSDLKGMGITGADFKYLTAAEQRDMIGTGTFHYRARTASAANNRISPQKHARHIEGTKEHKDHSKKMAAAGRSKPSELHITQDEAAALVKQHSGKGSTEYTNDGSWVKQETCNAGSVVGVYYDMDNNPHETQWFKIMYANRNTHIVPVKEPRQ
ncbi:MAG: hypothetical protein IJ111_05820 [Eggerthellaceae bacterium]|nr:hypothetical protein [Eggerthellaceae bacterium]